MTDAAAENVISVENLTKSFSGRTVVDHLTMSVRKGAIHGFLGPNGSGKTTTIRMLCGLLTPDSGSGTCLGYDITRDGERLRRHVGYMTQRFSLYQDLTIRENLDFVARIHGLKNPRKKVSDAIERLGLGGREKQLAGNLSGGWKQRLALGACTLPGPDLLLLDEPTAGVDPKARREFWTEIHALAAEGLSVLVSTHYMDEAERCHEIAYMAYGKLVVSGTVDDVVAASKLHSYLITGPDVHQFQSALEHAEGVELVAPFGASLHVCGPDEAALERAIAPYRNRPGTRCSRSEATLEDAFIYLMNASKDNFDDR
ncbi:ABC transporter ATP-binding protein [Martelella soudanensis]|uniref:ABC transporter ATP-binding protein n=1 Tax=unclassified Martelella TaxID=2629616 RepID=UPI0015DDB38B|nr:MULTISPECIES: ABC transporter ATP-binding protein [unclassified Martelella]